MKQLKTVGRVLFGLPFIVFGAFHFMAAEQFAQSVPPLFPGPGVPYVYIAGIVLLAGGLSIITSKYVMWAGKALALLLLIFIVTLHLPNLGSDQMGQLVMANLLKDTALLGGVLVMMAVYGKNCDCGTCENCKPRETEKRTNTSTTT